MKKALLSLMTTLTFNLCASQISHHSMTEKAQIESSYIWQEDHLQLFDELIVSWDAQRPEKGSYTIAVSLFNKTWSPWLDYAFWGVENQYTYDQYDAEGTFKTYQDAVEMLNGEKATGFKICIKANDGASLEPFRNLHACTTALKEHLVSEGDRESAFIELPVIGLSQIALPDERNMRLCSPTSTTAVINFLSPTLQVDPLTFADAIRDSAFDIYGNWVLNTAQASYLLGPTWSCYVARLTSFDQILQHLNKGIPVVVSVKGPINGGADPYASGHLIVVRGYDPESQKVLCMDPGFPQDQLTLMNYSLEDFMTAWRRRSGIVYLFVRHADKNSQI
jgi:hypothetical protein